MSTPQGLLAPAVAAAALLMAMAGAVAPRPAEAQFAPRSLAQKAPAADATPAREPDGDAKAAATPAERLEQIEREVRDEQAGSRPVPAGATPAQILEIGSQLQRIAAILQAQVDVQSEIAAVRITREEAERMASSWTGFDKPGPYPIAQLDGLFEDLDAERTRLNSLESVRRLGGSELEHLEATYKDLQAQERLALDRAAAGEPAALEVARLRARRVGELIELLRMQAELNGELTQTAHARVVLLERQATAVRASLRFDAADLERETGELQARLLGYERQIEAATAARAAATLDKDRARAVIDALPAPATADERRRRAEAEARLHAAQVTLDALRLQHSALTAMRGLTPMAIDLWTRRHAAMNQASPEARNAAVDDLESGLGRLQVLQSYVADLASLVDTLLQEQQRVLERTAPDAAGRRAEEAALARVRETRDVVSELQVVARKARTASEHWVEEIRAVDGQRPPKERLVDTWASVKNLGRAFWDFELFAVEDTLVIGGRPVTVARGVTVGKSIGALLLFIVGYSVALALTRRARRIMVAKLAMAPEQSKVLGRWIMIVVGFVLLVITLNLARIPLTVFAFLGGALAIGVGFGMQTLLKNLISGIMVLAERKIRVGDVVDVGGVQGVVTAVDVRSTTVRQSDGIETMVPNSMLLEQQVTNWTGETPTMRRVVKISVPYGSPVRQVADVLAAAAAEHGQVLKEPAPQVIFAEFGESALQFMLYFWVDITRHSGMQVQSDLRFMLDKRLAEAGIVISAPRDVRVTGLPPLRVEGASGASGPAPGAGPQPAAGSA